MSGWRGCNAPMRWRFEPRANARIMFSHRMMEQRSLATSHGPVLATGAWLKNRACLLQGDQPVWSAMHGDLGDPASCEALEASVAALISSARGRIVAVAHDLHPDFFSTRLAIVCAASLGVPAIGVQHHHAHIAAVMAEHAIAEPVIGLALDGVGLGTDGMAWGGELLWVAPEGWRRLGHLWPLALAGGDVAAREPWRMAASALQAMGRGDEIEARFASSAGAQPARIVAQMLSRGLNCPMTSSAGRWFDAVAGALGLSVRQAHEAEAAIALQACAAEWIAVHGEVPEQPLDAAAPLDCLDLRPLLEVLFDRGQDATYSVHTEPVEVPARVLTQASTGSARTDGKGDGEAAAHFHATLADALAAWAIRAAREAQTDIICLGGGCFANTLLTDRLTRRLTQRSLRVLTPTANSCGDAGLALGQAWVAAQQLAHQRAHSASASSQQVNPTTHESPSCA